MNVLCVVIYGKAKEAALSNSSTVSVNICNTLIRNGTLWRIANKERDSCNISMKVKYDSTS